MLDGFDVLVMSFAAASVSSEWALTPYQLGILLRVPGLLVWHSDRSRWAPSPTDLGRRKTRQHLSCHRHRGYVRVGLFAKSATVVSVPILSPALELEVC